MHVIYQYNTPQRLGLHGPFSGASQPRLDWSKLPQGIGRVGGLFGRGKGGALQGQLGWEVVLKYGWEMVHPGRWTCNLRMHPWKRKKSSEPNSKPSPFEVLCKSSGVYKKLEILIKQFGSSDSLVIWNPEVWLVCRKRNKIDEYDLFLSTRLDMWILYRREEDARFCESQKSRNHMTLWCNMRVGTWWNMVYQW